MQTTTARIVRPRLWLVLAVHFVFVLSVLIGFAAQAQEQFYTQSGGRGLQNAKTNARLSKVEGDVEVLNVEMAKIKPHAKAELGSCPDSGDKLRWTGNNWVCDRETDPTVQGFAKKALPTCSGSSILGVSGGEFACVDGGFVSNETDPTVQSFAKSPLPSCGQDQILTVSNGNLSCITDQKGLTRETDPMVHSFARVDTNPALPNCAHTEVLTMVAGNLLCKADSMGITEEVDPFTAGFARTDIPGYSLAACGSGEILRSAVDAESSKIILQCESAGDALAGALALGDLSDVNTAAQASGTVLIYNGTEWVAGNEVDPTVSDWAKTNLAACAAGQVLTYDGTSLSCVDDAGGSASPLTFAGLNDVNVAGVADGQFVKYDLATSKWVPGTVQGFAQATLPTCTTGQVLTGDGTNLTCTNDAGGSSDPLDLVELGDVRTGPSTVLSPNTNDFLRYNAGTSKWEAVHDKLSGTLTTSRWCYYDGTNVVCDRGAPLQCAAGSTLYWNNATNAFECLDATTALGLGDMALQSSNTVAIHGGSINGTTIGGSVPADGTFSNIRVIGNLYVSGSQSIDGVTFANGGLNASGVVTATYFVGDGSGLTNINLSSVGAPGNNMQLLYNDGGVISNTAGLYWDKATNRFGVGTPTPGMTFDVTGNSRVTGDLTVTGNLNVSGSQNIDGVTFANGGVAATGVVTATSFAGDGSGLTGLAAGNIAGSGVDGSVQFREAGTGIVSGSAALVWDAGTQNLDVAGTVQMAGTGAEACDANGRGRVRFVDVGGGDYRLQVCKP